MGALVDEVQTNSNSIGKMDLKSDLGENKDKSATESRDEGQPLESKEPQENDDDGVIDDLAESFEKKATLEPQEGDDTVECCSSDEEEDDICNRTKDLQLYDDEEEEEEDIYVQPDHDQTKTISDSESSALNSKGNIVESPSEENDDDSKTQGDKEYANVVSRHPMHGVVTQPVYHPETQEYTSFDFNIDVEQTPKQIHYSINPQQQIKRCMEDNHPQYLSEQPGVKYMLPSRQPVEHDESAQQQQQQQYQQQQQQQQQQQAHYQQLQQQNQHQVQQQQQFQQLQQHQHQMQLQQQQMQTLQQQQQQHQLPNQQQASVDPQNQARPQIFRTKSNSGMSGGVAVESRQESLPENVKEEVRRLNTVLSTSQDLSHPNQPGIQATSNIQPQARTIITARRQFDRTQSPPQYTCTPTQNGIQQQSINIQQNQHPSTLQQFADDLLNEPPSIAEMSMYIKGPAQQEIVPALQQQVPVMTTAAMVQALSPSHSTGSQSPGHQPYSPPQQHAMSPIMKQEPYSPAHQQAMSPAAQQQVRSPQQQDMNSVNQIQPQQPYSPPQMVAMSRASQEFCPSPQHAYSPGNHQPVHLNQSCQPQPASPPSQHHQLPGVTAAQQLANYTQQQQQNLMSQQAGMDAMAQQTFLTGPQQSQFSQMPTVSSTNAYVFPGEPPRLHHLPDDASSTRTSNSSPPLSTYAESMTLSPGSTNDQVLPDMNDPLNMIPSPQTITETQAEELKEFNKMIEQMQSPGSANNLKEVEEFLGDFCATNDPVLELETKTLDLPTLQQHHQHQYQQQLQQQQKQQKSHRLQPKMVPSKEDCMEKKIENIVKQLPQILPIPDPSKAPLKPPKAAVIKASQPSNHANDVQKVPTRKDPPLVVQENENEVSQANSYVSSLKTSELCQIDEDKYSYLHIAIEDHKFYFVKAMLSRLQRENKLDQFINEMNGESKTPLYMALTSTPEDNKKPYMGLEIIWTLIDYGADVNIKCLQRQSNAHQLYQNAIHLAAVMCRPDILRILLWLDGADVNAQNTEQETPLHCAINKHNMCRDQPIDSRPVIKLLAEHGADFSIKAKTGRTVLHTIAEKKWDEELLKHTIQNIPRESRESIINQQDDCGNTVLHLLLSWTSRFKKDASKDKNKASMIRMLRIFLDAGADPRIRDQKNQLPQNYVQKDQEILDMLKPPPTTRSTRGSRHGNASTNHQQAINIQPMVAMPTACMPIPPQQHQLHNMNMQIPGDFNFYQNGGINPQQGQGHMGMASQQPGNHGNLIQQHQQQQFMAQTNCVRQ